MKVGNMVKYKKFHGPVEDGKFVSEGLVGIIVEEGIYTGGDDLIVLWPDKLCTERTISLEIVDEAT
jgi:hypothetical protein